jgi:hypothetical protein
MTAVFRYQQATVSVDDMRERELFIFLVLLVWDVQLGYEKQKPIKNIGETQSL